MKDFFIKEVDLNNVKLKKLAVSKNSAVAKLCIKTAALWIASEYIQKGIFPNRTVDEVYEALKLKGKKKVLSEKPNLKKYIK